MTKLIRLTTVPMSLELLIPGQMNFMASHGFEVYMVSSPETNIEKLEEKENSKFIPVKMTRLISPVRDLISLFKLIRVFSKLKPTIVHTHTPKAGIVGMLAAWICRVPLRMHTVSGLPLMETRGFKHLLLDEIEKLTYYCANLVYPNSTKLAHYIVAHKYCNIAKIKVVGNGSSNGIDVKHYQLTPEIAGYGVQLKKQLGITEGNFVFIFIGRLVKDKGLEELIHAFLKLHKKYNHVRLLLVGFFEPNLDPLPKETVKSIETEDSILHVGFQSDIRPYLAISHALVFPSHREGFPNVPMQAGCFQLPSIVTDINGCNEIIEPGINGLIIPVKDEPALYKAMYAFINDEALYLRLKSNARCHIVERYEQNYFWSLLLEEYQFQLKKQGIVS